MHTESVGLYIHVPFCAVKCPYCDFYSEKYSSSPAREYTDAVIRNISAYGSKKINAESIYFGGGTPSILPPEYIERIVECCYNNFIISSDAEITIECNPGTMQKERLKKYLEIGVNRISVGVQSMNDDELLFLGRKHTSAAAAASVQRAIEIGFKNISCDIMIAFPHQTIQSLYNTIEKLTDLHVTHISSYILKIEENTLFNNKEIINALPSDELCADIYLEMCRILENKGFKQYEISNFSIPGYESRHNTKYWQCGEYIGIGPAAHSYYENKRFYSPCSLSSFCKNDLQEKIIVDNNPGNKEEKVMLALRLKKGISLKEYPLKNKKISEMLCREQLIEIKNQRLFLTAKGFLVSNAVILKILDAI